MHTDHHARNGFALLVSAAFLTASVGGCASEPKPRPTALDSANPGAPESQPLAVSALGRSAGLPAADAATGDPAKGTPATSEADHGHNHGDSASHQAADTSGQSGNAARQPPTIYTCPMHPEVISDKPGRCPKCGMTLVPKEPSEGKK